MPTELDGFMARLTGDPTDLIRAFAMAEQKAASSGLAMAAAMKKADAQMKESLGEGMGTKFAEGIQTAVGYASKAFQGFKATNELMKGGFATAGDEMRKIGDIAGMIPGPWGQAASSVLGFLAEIVDYSNRHLVKANKTAAESFMAVASGAATVPQAMRQMESKAIGEGLEKIVNNTLRIQGLQRNRTGGATDLYGRSASDVAVTRLEQQNQREIQRTTDRIEMQNQAFRALMETPETRNALIRSAEVNLAGQSEEMMRSLQMRSSRRAMMQAMSGAEAEVGPDGSLRVRGRDVRQAIQEVETMRLMQATGISAAEAQLRLADATSQARIQAQFQQVATAGAAAQVERLRESTRQQVRTAEEHGEAIGLTSGEAEIATMERRYQEAQERLAALPRETGARMSEEDQRARAQSIIQMRQQAEGLAGRRGGQYEDSVTGEIHTAERARATLIQRAAAAERELNEISDRGSRDRARARAAGDLGAIQNNIINRRIAEERNTRTEASRGDFNIQATMARQLEAYQEQREIAEGTFRFTADMSREQVAIDVMRRDRVSEYRIQLAEITMELNRQARIQQQMVQAGTQATQQTRLPTETYAAELERLRLLLDGNFISTETYRRAVERADTALESAARSQRDLNDAMNPVQGAGRGSAEAMQRLMQQQARFRVLSVDQEAEARLRRDQQLADQRRGGAEREVAVQNQINQLRAGQEAEQARERRRLIAEDEVGQMARIQAEMELRAEGAAQRRELENREAGRDTEEFAEAAFGGAGRRGALLGDAQRILEQLGRQGANQEAGDVAAVESAATLTDMLRVLRAIAERELPGVAGL